MADLVTQPGDADPAAFLAAVEPAARHEDALALDAIFRETTGFGPVIWGTSIVGYGVYDYTYATGHSGRWPATGFAPRRAGMVVYIMPGYSDFGEILEALGPHRKGKSCLYLPRLAKVDTQALRRLIRAGLDDLATHWPVSAT